jgi:hypothetical protein
MADLTADEQRYLMEAFDASPREWFRPAGVAQERFSDREIDRIVAVLVRAGMMDGQPDCHARLTERGRKHAMWLSKPARNKWRGGQGGRRIAAAAATALGAVVILLYLMRWKGIF